jgi:hypothetical protein
MKLKVSEIIDVYDALTGNNSRNERMPSRGIISLLKPADSYRAGLIARALKPHAEEFVEAKLKAFKTYGIHYVKVQIVDAEKKVITKEVTIDEYEHMKKNKEKVTPKADERTGQAADRWEFGDKKEEFNAELDSLLDIEAAVDFKPLRASMLDKYQEEKMGDLIYKIMLVILDDTGEADGKANSSSAESAG